MTHTTFSYPDYVDVHLIQIPVSMAGQTDAIQQWLDDCNILGYTFYPPRPENSMPGLLYFYDASVASLFALAWGHYE
jgi:hypothetical protein